MKPHNYLMIYACKSNGVINWHKRFANNNYSQYYPNNKRYELEDARLHIKEINQRLPDLHLMIVEIIITNRVIETTYKAGFN